MSSAENRRALRVSCALPVRVAARGARFAGTIQDVSRTGLRLWIPTTELGSDAESLLAMAQLVDEQIGSKFQGDLHYEMLGPLIRKQLQIVRLGQSAMEPAVELGCVFDVPLTDDESSMLGLGLPELGVTTPGAYRAVPGPQRRGAEDDDSAPSAPRAYDAYVHPTEGLGAEPLAGETHGMQEFEAVVQAPLAPSLACADVPSLTVALSETYGPEPILEILDGLRMVWSGRADIRHVEVTSSEQVRIHMAGRD